MQCFSITVTLTSFALGNGKRIQHFFKNIYKLTNVRRPSKEDSVDELRARITPSDLREYRISHRMLGPCCLCPMIDINQPDFVEAAMYMPSTGPFAGQYIATCARDQCGYFGKLALLQFQNVNETIYLPVTHLSVSRATI